MIGGYAQHGEANDALELFSWMFKQDGLVKPNSFTISCALIACARLAALRLGRQIHAYIFRNHFDSAFLYVANCLIDMYAKSGDIDVARFVFDNLKQKNFVSWTSIMTGYGMHGRGEEALEVFEEMRRLGEHAAKQLLELNSENDGSYTLLSNIYANARRWKDVARVRSLMKNIGIRKRPGCSWVQGKKGTTTFYVADKTHPQSKQIYEILRVLIQRIKVLGYVPETSFALHDVDDEEKDDLLFEHSEKLALAYGILISAPGAPHPNHQELACLWGLPQCHYLHIHDH
ncbi:hypothetical protein OIU85_014003 [Salix viminalis]|uniref:DYW domain-containing protein n=1 Tax=Salix viminalis TaxID=40686 RepID=A0A9Q0NN56_SALVM|nr:hypothetical protein OIU85_014003 [Salix viminalis]